MPDSVQQNTNGEVINEDLHKIDARYFTWTASQDNNAQTDSKGIFDPRVSGGIYGPGRRRGNRLARQDVDREGSY